MELGLWGLGLGLGLDNNDNNGPVFPVSPVSPGPRLPLRDGDHGLHGDDHPGPDHRVDVLPELQTRLPPVIMTQHTKAVTIAK